MKGIICAAGWGTRMLPATKTINKHLLPLYIPGKGAIPMIDFPIQTLKNMGIKEILVITSKEHSSIIVDYLDDGYARELDFTYKIQDMEDPARPPGIGAALNLCQSFTNDKDFVVILGDNFFEHSPKLNLEKTKRAKIYCKEVSDWNRFGILKLDDNSIPEKIVEKPADFISNLAITGLYHLDKSIYEVIPDLNPSGRGEIEIADILNYYLNKNELECNILDTFWSDMGTPESILKTQLFIHEKNSK